jgi:hypothetical protein
MSRVEYIFKIFVKTYEAWMQQASSW